MNWRPIHTAPRDSSSILIYCPKSERKPVCEAWWAIAYDGDTGGHWQTPIGPAGRGYTILSHAPTHWMPLPSPPEALAEQPAQGEAVPDGMWKISKLIATLQSTHDRFGDTCVWMRECKWGAAALHAKSEAEAAPPAPSEQPAQGEAVAWRFSPYPAAPKFRVLTEDPDATQFARDCGVAVTELFTAPPAPAVPDDVAQDAARYRFIRSADCHVHCIYFTSFGERFNLAGEDLDHSIDAAMLASAPARKS